MIPSLRYLCLEKVIAQGEDYEDLPEILVKDINLMKVFNGTYSWGDWWETVRMKIFYDGKMWNFKSRTSYHDDREEDDDGIGVCFCKYCWDTTGCNHIDITVMDGEVIQGESYLLDFLGIEQEDMNISGWTFKVDLQSNDNKHPSLVERYGEVKSLGVVAFNGVGQGDSVVLGRFQAEGVTHEWLWEGQEDWPAEERTYLHRRVSGSVNNSRLYSKFYDGFVAWHASWWRDPTTHEICFGVNSFSKMEESEESDREPEVQEEGSDCKTPSCQKSEHQILTEDVVAKVNDNELEDIVDVIEVAQLEDCPPTHTYEKVEHKKLKDVAQDGSEDLK